MNFAHVSAFSFGKDKKGMKHFILGKFERTDRLTTPGPGSYTPGLTKRSTPGWK